MAKFEWPEWVGILHKQGCQLYSAKNDLAVIAAACERLGLMVLANDLCNLSEKIDNARYEIRKVIQATFSEANGA